MVCVPRIWSLRFRWVILLLLVFVGGVVLSGVDLRSFLYQYEVKSGWFLDPTNFGGSVPLHGESSSNDVGWLPVLVVPNSSMPSDAMVKNHLFQLGRSAFKVRVGLDMLLKTATKDYVLRQGGDRLRSWM